MQVDIKTDVMIDKATIIDLDKSLCEFTPFDNKLYKFLIPCNRHNIIDIIISGESIKHCLNSGREVDQGYEIWLHGI